MKRKITLLLFLTNSIFLFGEGVNPVFDSLEQVINTSSDITVENKLGLYRKMLLSLNIIGPTADSILDIGTGLAREFELPVSQSNYIYYHFEHWRASSYTIPDSAMQLMEVLDSLAIANPEDPVCQLNAFIAKSVYYRKDYGRPDADNAIAIHNVEQSVELLKSGLFDDEKRREFKQNGIAGAYIRLAQLWDTENRTDKAVLYYNNVLKMPGRFPNKKIAMLNLPDLYARLHDWKGMREAAFEARNYLNLEKSAPYADIYAILRLSKAELKLGNLDEALRLINEGWPQIQSKRLKRYEDEMLKLELEVLFAKGEFDQVIERAKEPVVNRHPIHRAGALTVLGETYIEKKDYPKAKASCHQSLKLLEGRKRFLDFVAEYRMHACGCLADAYKALGQEALANKYLTEFVAYQEKFGENYLSIISKAVNQIEIDKKEVALKAQADKELAIYENRLFYYKSGAALITGFLLMVLFGLWNLRKKNGLINDQKASIQESLKEKELLLKEIHHRVKNNLQVVSSLLRLQSNYITDSSALSAINEGRNRVKSMALIHQDLYKEDRYSGIKVKSYFKKLLKNLFDTYKVSDESIQLETHIDDLTIDVDTIVPLGLITNELISNSLKYAFDGPGAVLHISFTENEGGYLLNVKDNGKGFDKEKLEGKTKSFGYQMVQAFVKKLNAEMRIDTKAGTDIQIQIPKDSNE